MFHNVTRDRLLQLLIVRPHRMHTENVTYCYRCSMVCLSVYMSMSRLGSGHGWTHGKGIRGNGITYHLFEWANFKWLFSLKADSSFLLLIE